MPPNLQKKPVRTRPENQEKSLRLITPVPNRSKTRKLYKSPQQETPPNLESLSDNEIETILNPDPSFQSNSQDWRNLVQLENMQNFLDDSQENQIPALNQRLLENHLSLNLILSDPAQGLDNHNPAFYLESSNLTPSVYQSSETGGEINCDSEPFIRSYPGDTMTGLMTLKLGTKPSFQPQQLNKHSTPHLPQYSQQHDSRITENSVLSPPQHPQPQPQLPRQHQQNSSSHSELSQLGSGAGYSQLQNSDTENSQPQLSDLQQTQPHSSNHQHGDPNPEICSSQQFYKTTTHDKQPSAQQLTKKHLKILQKIRERNKNLTIRETQPSLLKKRSVGENRIYPTVGKVESCQTKVSKCFSVGANFVNSSCFSSSIICRNDPGITRIKRRRQTRSLPNVSIIPLENLPSGNLDYKKLCSDGLLETTHTETGDRDENNQSRDSQDELNKRTTVRRFSRILKEYNSRPIPDLETLPSSRAKHWKPWKY